MKLGETLKKYRVKRYPKKRQEDVAKIIGISQGYLSQVENERKYPETPTLNTMCKLYRVHPNVVLWESMEEKDVPKAKREAFNRIKPSVDDLIKELL